MQILSHHLLQNILALQVCEIYKKLIDSACHITVTKCCMVVPMLCRLNFQRRQKIQPSQIINSSQMCGKSGRFEIFTSIHHKCAEVREVEVFTSTHHKCVEVREVEVFTSTHHKCVEVREVEGFTSIHHKCASRGD